MHFLCQKNLIFIILHADNKLNTQNHLLIMTTSIKLINNLAIIKNIIIKLCIFLLKNDYNLTNIKIFLIQSIFSIFYGTPKRFIMAFL